MNDVFVLIPEKKRLAKLFEEIGKGHEYAKEHLFPRIMKYAGVATSPDGLATILGEELEFYVTDNSLPIEMEEDIYSFAKNELINILVDDGGIREEVRKRVSNKLKV